MSNKQKKQLKKIITALVIFFALLILEKVSDHTGFLKIIFGNRLITFLLYMVPYMLVGWPVVRKAFLGIKNLQPFDESFLMTLATIGAFVTSANSEACAVMLFYQIGEFFQDYAVRKSRKSIKSLMEIAPDEAFRRKADGEIEEIDPSDVEIGDTIVVKPGEKIPVDGIVTRGEGLINTSALTGESLPKHVEPGDDLISGCINGENLIEYKAEKKYEDSTVAKILDMVENASEKKSRTENFITRFARVYTPAVVIAAVLLALVPSLITGHPFTWVYRACTFLVISCPCALVISVPLAFFGGIGAASREGILVKGSNYLELMADLETIVTDKTGTLTRGEFVVSDVLAADGFDKEMVLELAALTEAGSSHPIAASICRAYKENVNGDAEKSAENIENVSGKGIISTVDGRRVLAGNEKLMNEEHIAYKTASDPYYTVVYVAYDGTFAGSILLADEVKPGTYEVINKIRKYGVKNVIMLTGDRRETAEAVKKKLGLDKAYSELLPLDKVNKVDEILSSSDGKLAFIGDGINDAPVLARADVGIAMGSLGSDAAIEAADIVIMDDDLAHIPAVIRIARKTVMISKENIVFALAVKAVILILGALGLANMWAAVFADVGVAIIDILNSMRLMRRKSK